MTTEIKTILDIFYKAFLSKNIQLKAEQTDGRFNITLCDLKNKVGAGFSTTSFDDAVEYINRKLAITCVRH